jgi:hypothetical protein
MVFVFAIYVPIVQWIAREIYFNQNGISVIGRITDLEHHTIEDSDSDSIKFTLFIEFTTEDGRDIVVEHTNLVCSNTDTYYQNKGKQVHIIYDDLDPYNFLFKGIY